MRTLLQINTTLNRGSTGRIAEQIGVTAMTAGWNSFIAHGARYRNPSRLQAIQIDSLWSEWVHCGWRSLLLDRHGLGSTFATKRLIHRIEHEIRPDIIHLHNTHGYYLNYRVLFDYLAKTDIPVVWTLHDCWPFTGHCPYFDLIKCERWKTGCYACPQLKAYPKSFFRDNSRKNWELKKALFAALKDRLMLVPVSDWLANLLQQSFFAGMKFRTIHNGVDIDTFRPRPINQVAEEYGLQSRYIIIGVASPWSERKGLTDFIRLRTCLPLEQYAIILVGLSPKQMLALPAGITGIERTQDVAELAGLYGAADVFVNPTYEDNYPTVNLEAMACGTPVITYRTGGSPEAVSSTTGFVVDQGDIEQLAAAVRTITMAGKQAYSAVCRKRAEEHFNKNMCFQEYLNLYNALIAK